MPNSVTVAPRATNGLQSQQQERRACAVTGKASGRGKYLKHEHMLARVSTCRLTCALAQICINTCVYIEDDCNCDDIAEPTGHSRDAFWINRQPQMNKKGTTAMCERDGQKHGESRGRQGEFIVLL